MATKSGLAKSSNMIRSEYVFRLKECNALNIIFQLTDKCVLSCKYCFAKGAHEGKPVIFPEDILERAIMQAFDTRHDYVVFEWTGGEPLLAGITFFEKVVNLQKKYATKPYENGVQTSGNLLDKDLIDYLLKNNFSISTTIDGPPSIHNSNRPTSSGGDSYELVKKTREYIASQGKFCGFISTITQNNIGKERQMLDFFSELGISEFHSNPYVFYSQNKVKDKSIALGVDDYAKFFIAEFNAWVERGKLAPTPRTINDIIKCFERHAPIHNTICTFGGRCLGNFIAITPNGDAYMCPKFTGSPNMILGNINEYSIDKLLSYSHGKMNDFVDQRVEAMKRCKDSKCKYLFICNGGCPYYSFIASDGRNISAEDCMCNGKYLLFNYLDDILSGGSNRIEDTL